MRRFTDVFKLTSNFSLTLLPLEISLISSSYNQQGVLTSFHLTHKQERYYYHLPQTTKFVPLEENKRLQDLLLGQEIKQYQDQ